MNINQNKKILQRIVNIEKEMNSLKEIRIKLASQEFVSASMSSSGGSRSYTRADLSKISNLIAELNKELKSLNSILNGTASGLPKQIAQVWF